MLRHSADLTDPAPRRKNRRTKPQPARIVVEIEGGNVQAIYANTAPEVTVLDYDNMKAEGKTDKQRQALFGKAVKGLRAIY